MAYMKNRTAKYGDQCKLLTQSVTGFQETDENFQLCLDFAVSNLLYHKYPDVNCFEIKKKISRLHERFLITSNSKKAESFECVTSKLLAIIEKKNDSEKEVGFKILAFLLHLWETCKEFDEFGNPSILNFSDSGDESLSFDWSAYLHEDDINLQPFSDVSSEFSQSDESTTESPSNEDSLDSLPDPLLRPPTRDDSGLGISPDSCSGTSQHFHVPVSSQECLLITSKHEKHPLTFYPYWAPKYQKSYGSCPHNLLTMNFTKIWNDHVVNQNLFSLIEKKSVLHERNVVKEILWMLCGAKELFIAHWDGRKYVPYSQIHLTNLTSNTLYITLNEFCYYATKQTLLRDFLYKDLLDTSQHCRTYQAYAQSLLEDLQKIQNSVSSFDEKLRKGNEIFTLLSLKLKMQPLFNEIDLLYNIHMEVTASVRDVQEPLLKACTVLNILWKLLYHSSLLEKTSLSLKIVLKIFLKTCKPYFTFLEELMILGSFKDPYEEFLVKREDKQPTDETFWESGYSLRSLPRDLQEEFFLKSFVTDILCAGKSLEILHMINFLHNKEPFQSHVVKGAMYSKFIHILCKLICKDKPTLQLKADDSLTKLEKLEPREPVLEETIFHLSSSFTKFFQPSVNPAHRCVSPRIPECLYPKQLEDTLRILEHLEPTCLTLLSSSIMKALSTCMEFAYYPVCHRLIKSLKNDHCIIAHLNVMQKYFLMEAGDLMYSFYSEIFRKIFYKESWTDGSFLYSALKNAIFVDKENSEKLHIFLDVENRDINFRQSLTRLSALKISYEANWPESIMLGPKIQSEYCQIFSFLLQIKCAKYLLDNLYCTSLYEIEPQAETHLRKALLKTKFPREQKIHGMYILRMRLMFFVNGLHTYIMARILHSFGLEFLEILENCRTVDEMIAAHARYLKSLQERCLLDRRISFLKEQIVHVLHLCHTFQEMWMKGIDQIWLEELQELEERFSKYSNFLLCCFNTPLRRGTYVHVESLVSTMLSNTHSFHVFSNKD
ncbi:Gamma-tubulin complex component 5 [Araneus ventricosus]|uniref:Gamma-tubulin complex component n=1 Tax=Araneus ventricosus TaxID=182803 RepID=A0A4Y2IAW2_ARAVE|nr:Gamma-tubulin complex component 5 [Araneus ventricosus]